MIKRLLNAKISSIAGAAIVIALAGLASRLLGVVRDRVLAGQFGAGEVLDMYYAAFRIPDLVYNLVILGALSAGFIPIFTALIKKDEPSAYNENQSAWDLVNRVINVFSLVLIAVCALLFVFTDQLLPLLAPGFAVSQIEITAGLTRIMFLSPVLLGLSGIVSGVLQSYKRFLIYSLAPILYNLGIIFGALFLVPALGINGLAWGVVLGAFLHLAVQVPVVFKLGFHYRPLFSLRDSNLRKIFKLMIPRLLGLAINQVNLVVVTIFGSMLAVGSLAVYNFANNLQSLPLGLIGVAFAMAAFPTLSVAAARHDQKEFNSRFASTVRLILFTIIPVMTLFIILRLEITELILGSGKFTWSAMVATANTLGIFSISLAAQCLVQLFVRAFFARQNTVVPFVAGLITALLNIILCWILIDQFAVLGLALAFTISSVVNFLILAFVLRWQIGRINENRILSTFNKVTLSSLIMAAVILLIKYFSFSFIPVEGFWRILLFCAVATLIGLAVFFSVCKITKCQEFEIIIDAFRKKVLRKVKIENDSIGKVE